MSYRLPYPSESAPKLGAVFNSIGAFSSGGKDLEEGRFTKLFEDFKREGVISKDSVLVPRIFGPHEALAAADRFASEQVDAVLIYNSAFPNGHVFPTVALHPNLSRTPVIVSAGFEPDLGDAEWTTNAWCGVIMNNYVAKQVGRYIRPLAGNPETEEYRDELKMLLNSYRAAGLLRRGLLGRFGDAPGGFHSSTMDQMAYLRTFGVRMETIDLLGVMSVYNSGRASGYNGEVSFNESDVKATAEEMKAGRPCLVDEVTLLKGARFYHALKAIIETNGFTSIAVKCWPELTAPDVRIAACLPMTWLQTKGIVAAAGCEADCPTAVIQTLATYLSGRPAACLDFIDYTGTRSCIELGHCGVGIAGQMEANSPEIAKDMEKNGSALSDAMRKKIESGEAVLSDGIDYKSPDRQGGDMNGPAYVGRFREGRKTALAIMQSSEGFKILSFTGETAADEPRKRFCFTSVDVPEYRKLNELILKHGFPHHLAVALTDVSREMAEICALLGIEYIDPSRS